MVGPWFTNWFPNPKGLLLNFLCLPSFPGSQPWDVPLRCANSRHPSRPIPRTPHLPILPGLLCGPSHTPFSVPSPSPFIPCLYLTRPPATLWRGPIGSSTVRGPFCAPSMGRSFPSPFHLGGVFLSSPVGGSSSWPRPRYPCFFPAWSPVILFVFFSRHPRPLFCTACSFPFPPRLLALCSSQSGGACGVFFRAAPPPFPQCFLPCGTLLPACTHVSTALVIGSLFPLCSSPVPRPPGACPLAFPGHVRRAPLPRVPVLPSLSFPPSPPPPLPCLSPALLLLLSCSVCSPLVFPAQGL